MSSWRSRRASATARSTGHRDSQPHVGLAALRLVGHRGVEWRGGGPDRRGLPRRDGSGTAILVVRIIWDGKDNTLEVRLARATAATFAGSEHALSKTFESRAEAMIAAEAAVLEQLARSA